MAGLGYNPNRDPSNGQFTSGGESGSKPLGHAARYHDKTGHGLGTNTRAARTAAIKFASKAAKRNNLTFSEVRSSARIYGGDAPAWRVAAQRAVYAKNPKAEYKSTKRSRY